MTVVERDTKMVKVKVDPHTWADVRGNVVIAKGFVGGKI